MKIGICLVGDMTARNRDWNRTKEGISKNLINCWEKENKISVFLCSNFIPQDIIEYYRPEKVIVTENKIKEKYLAILAELINYSDFDFFIFTRPDIVFLKPVSSFNVKYDKFNFLFREVNHWDQGYTCDNFYATSKENLIFFYKTLLDCKKVKKSEGELHSQVYPCLVDYITEKNIHFVGDFGYSCNGESIDNSVPGYLALNDFYLLDRYNQTPGDLGPITIQDFQKWYRQNPDKVKYLRDQIESNRQDLFMEVTKIHKLDY